jgi:hypothetical protein
MNSEIILTYYKPTGTLAIAYAMDYDKEGRVYPFLKPLSISLSEQLYPFFEEALRDREKKETKYKFDPRIPDKFDPQLSKGCALHPHAVTTSKGMCPVCEIKYGLRTPDLGQQNFDSGLQESFKAECTQKKEERLKQHRSLRLECLSLAINAFPDDGIDNLLRTARKIEEYVYTEKCSIEDHYR